MSEQNFVYLRVGGTKSDRLIMCKGEKPDFDKAREVAERFFPDMFNDRRPTLTSIDWMQFSGRVKEQLLVCQQGNNWNDRPYVAILLDYSDGGDILCQVAGTMN